MTLQTLLLTHIGTAPVVLDGSQLCHLITAFLGHETVLDMHVYEMLMPLQYLRVLCVMQPDCLHQSGITVYESDVWRRQ